MKYVIPFLIFVLLSVEVARSQGSGKALDFDATDDFVEVPSVQTLNDIANTGNTITIEAWINLSTLGGANTIVSKMHTADDQPLYSFVISPTGNLNFTVTNGSVPDVYNATSPTLLDQNWHHVAITHTFGDGTSTAVYKNGRLATGTWQTGGGNSVNSANTNSLFIGRMEHNSLPGWFNGWIDEVRIWNYARSQTQLRDKMCSKLNGTENGLVAYWRMDDGSGNTVTDNGPNSYDGTRNGPAWGTSAAPLGDTSAYTYATGNWIAQSVSMPAPSGDVFGVDSITHQQTPDGIHVYRVDAVPNVTFGINGLGSNNKYFGVFGCNGTGVKYTIDYDFFNYNDVCNGCESDIELFTRNDNAINGWLPVNVNIDIPNRVAFKDNESSIAFTYRAEYILGSDGAPVGEPYMASFEELSVYPNPARDFITVKTSSISSVQVIDIMGRVAAISTNKPFQIDVRELSAGLYTLRVTDLKGREQFRKIMIR